MSHLTRLTLRLSRNPDAGFPEGARDRGYVIVAPLDSDLHLDGDLWRDTRAQCTVTRFSPDATESADGLLTHRGNNWRFAYDEEDEGPDEAGWKLGSHRFEVGAYVTITNGDGEELVYQISEANKV